MKQIELKTIKGTWLVSEMPQNTKRLSDWFDELPNVSLDSFRNRFSLKDISELEASMIVDESYIKGLYETFDKSTMKTGSAVKCLHSLLKSKEITDLTNKYIFQIK